MLPLPSAKTVFLPAPGTLAIIVTRKGNRQRQRRRKFKDAHAALSWCIKHEAALVYTPAVPDETRN